MSAPDPNLHPQASEIVEEHRATIVSYHTAVGGKLISIHDLFNTIAMSNGKQPMPPPAIAFLVQLTDEQKQNAGAEGPVVTADQLVEAFKKMVPANDDKTVFDAKVVQHIRDANKRLEYSAKIFPEIEEALEEFYTKIGGSSDKIYAWFKDQFYIQIGGSLDKIYAWFKDLLPADAPNIPKDAFLGMVMKVPPTSEVVPKEFFMLGIKSNMDESDTADKFKTACAKHMA